MLEQGLRPWPPVPGAAGRRASAASLPVSPAAASAAWAWFSSLSSISLPCSLSALRSAAAAPALALPWPWAISCSSLASASRTTWVACARTSGSTLGLAGLAGASDRHAARDAQLVGPHRHRRQRRRRHPRPPARPAPARSGTHPRPPAAGRARRPATAGSAYRRWPSSGLPATPGPGPASRERPCASASAAAWASRHDLVDSTSMRCASSTAASRCTWTRCCRSSMPLMRSASWAFREASGSRLSGAPALAASRCQAMASAILSLASASSALAFSAHSAAIASWPLAALDLVELFAQQPGRALVAAAELAEHLLHLLRRWDWPPATRARARRVRRKWAPRRRRRSACRGPGCRWVSGWLGSLRFLEG